MARKRMFAHACRIAGMVFLAAIVVGCAKKPPANKTAEGSMAPGSARDFVAQAGDTVYFDTDSSQLSGAAQATLRAQVQWLRRYSFATVVIAGHADERGTREYNIALGAQRAEAVRGFLASNGIQGRRMRTTSYGKERPVAVCDDISCWSQNRRSVTQVTPRIGS